VKFITQTFITDKHTFVKKKGNFDRLTVNQSHSDFKTLTQKFTEIMLC